MNFKQEGNRWIISIGGIRGEIRKEENGKYSTEYLEKYVCDGFESLEEARSYLGKRFALTLQALSKIVP